MNSGISLSLIKEKLDSFKEKDLKVIKILIGSKGHLRLLFPIYGEEIPYFEGLPVGVDPNVLYGEFAFLVATPQDNPDSH